MTIQQAIDLLMEAPNKLLPMKVLVDGSFVEVKDIVTENDESAAVVVLDEEGAI